MHPNHGAHTDARRWAGSLIADAAHHRADMVMAACWAAVELVEMAWAAVRFQPPAESNAQAPTPGCQKARW